MSGTVGEPDMRCDASIVISSRNRPDLLLECLTSIAAQVTRRSVEVVVVDQSEAGHRLDAARAREPFAGTPLTLNRIVSDTVGASRGRNIGIRAARGGIVAVTDDDCRVDPRWIDRMCDLFEAEPDVMMACGRVLLWDPAHTGTTPAAIHPATTRAVFRRGADPSSLGSGNNVAFRRAALSAVGGYDERLGPGTPLLAGEDTELFYRVVRSGMKAVFHPEGVVYHRGWRTPEELLDLGWNYGFGSGVYLTREVIARRDPRAAYLLLRRVVRSGLWPYLGSVALGKRWHRRAAAKRMRGTLQGIWSVVVRRRGIDRGWVMADRGPDLDLPEAARQNPSG